MPNCPKCGSEMRVKKARRGPNAGGDFYSCIRYPECRGTLSMDGSVGASSQRMISANDVEAPDCPSCGSKMTIKTARKGRNAGSQFFGCSNYPACKEIVNIESKTTEGVLEREKELVLPVVLKAREKFDNYQVRFFQTLALPVEVLEQINCGHIDKDELLYHSQWRLDYPMLSGSTIDSKLKTVLAVALKILTRGQLTLISPDLEKSFKTKYKIKDNSFVEINCDFYAAFVNQGVNKTYNLFDSAIEERFYNVILPEVFGQYSYRNIVPQIDFSSLVPGFSNSEIDSRRADFLVNTKDGRAIVELDGEDHVGREVRDETRNSLLRRAGYEIFRIGNNEVAERIGENIQKFYDFFSGHVGVEDRSFTDYEKYCLSVKIAQQLQICIVEALLSGVVDATKKIIIQFDEKSVKLTGKEVESVLKNIEIDINELLRNLCKLYKVDKSVSPEVNITRRLDKNTDNSMLVSYNDCTTSSAPCFYIQDISYDKSIANIARSSKLCSIDDAEQENLEYFLNYIFRYTSFMEGQYEAILRALSGGDAIVLLPTGSGKSIAFQLATMILPGVSIVVDPIIALINDQIDNLQRIGIDRAIGITSQIKDPRDRKSFIESFGQGEYIFCYVAPERFQSEEFRDTLRTLTVTTPISVIVIDEAHCVSEWGHDFRTSYLNIGRVAREFCKHEGRVPPLLALTGTASNAVLRDVQRELQIADFDAIITPKTFDRPELRFFVFESSSSEKFNILKGCLQRLLPEKFNISDSSFYQLRGRQTNCGLVFCPHVGGSFGVVENAEKISSSLGIQAKFYGGTAPKGWSTGDWDVYKKAAAKDFKNNKFPLLIATKSFGMGIDKPNIRYTIHFGIPSSIESFYQEAGRAGRDRTHAECAILISNDDVERTSKLLDPDITPERIAEILNKETNWDNADDITRAIWFHSNSFKGVMDELLYVNTILENIDNLSSSEQITLQVSKDDLKSFEKGIHRLVILGIVSDYTINYANHEFNLKIKGVSHTEVINNYAKYVKGYNKGRVVTEVAKVKSLASEKLEKFISETSKILITFIYDTIERGRRRALREMLTLAEDPMRPENRNKDADTIIRERILRYLESTYSEEIENIINGESVSGLNELKKLIDGHETENGEMIGGIRSPKDASEIRGQVARYLESTPDHPGLLFLRSLAEIYCKGSEQTVIEQNLSAAINSAFNKYGIEKELLYDFLAWLFGKIFEHNEEVASSLLTKTIYEINDSHFAKTLISSSYVDIENLYAPSVFLFRNISQKAVNIFNN